MHPCSSLGQLAALLGLPGALLGCSGVSVSDESAQRLEPLATGGNVGTVACQVGVGDAPTDVVQFQNGLSVPGVVGAYAGTIDTYIESIHSATNYGNSDSLISKAGKSALLRFDLSSIPVGTQLRCATFGYYAQDPSFRDFSVYEVKQSWSEATATWQSYRAGSAWSAPGATGTSDVGTRLLAVLSGSATNRYYAPISLAVVQSWVDDPLRNHGFIIVNRAARDAINFASSETTDPNTEIRPSLFVGYPH